MNELQPFLDQLIVPAADESHTARALDRSLVALRNAPRMERKIHWTAWICATAAACAVLALVLHGQNQDSSARVFAELEHLFPGQLLAVVRSGEQTDLRLSAIPDPELSTDQRVRITVRSGGETTDILTYSGREVCIPLKSGALCLTPLVTGEGEVLVLTGDNAFTRSGSVHSASIRATTLTRS
jgi:hypothetical protein